MVNPSNYTISNKVQRCNVLSIIEEFNDDLKKCGKCMDIGCGPGDITKDILLPSLGSNTQIIGTDISEDMIKYANETMKTEKQLQFEILDIQTKNLPKKYNFEFDHIFSFYALHWCNDIRQAFKNIYQMLRPSGIILLYFTASHNLCEILRMLACDIRFEQYIPDGMKTIAPYQESKNPRKELKELLQCIGFTVHHCSLREKNFIGTKSELKHLLNSLMSILTFSKDMPHDLMEEFKNELTHEYMKRNINYKSKNGNQELILDLYKDLIVYAQKI